LRTGLVMAFVMIMVITTRKSADMTVVIASKGISCGVSKKAKEGRDTPVENIYSSNSSIILLKLCIIDSLFGAV
jgi:hypothetical protein